MKTLFVNHSASLDGGTHALISMVETLQDHGKISPLILLPCPGPMVSRINDAGIAYRIINVGHCNWDVSHIPMLRMFLREEKVDVIHANTLESYPAIIAANSCGISVVWHIHEMVSHMSYYAHAFSNLDREAFARLVSASHLICTASNASREAFY